MKLHAGLLPCGAVLVITLALGGCDMPAEAIDKARKTAAAGLAERDVAVTARVNAALRGDANLNGFAIEVAHSRGMSGSRASRQPERSITRSGGPRVEGV
jgi:hypothetical protein